MQDFDVEVAHQTTGNEDHLIISASTPEEAIKIARKKGFFIAGIRPVLTKNNSSFNTGVLILVTAAIFGVVIAIALIFSGEETLPKTNAPIAIKSPPKSLHIRLTSRNDAGDLVPVDQATIYLVPLSNQTTCNAWVDEYKSSISGKFDAYTEGLAKMIAAKIEISKLDTSMEDIFQQVKRDGQQVIVDSMPGNPASSSSQQRYLREANALRSLNMIKISMEEQEKQLTAEVNTIFSELNNLHIARLTELNGRMSSLNTVKVVAATGGEGDVLDVEKGDYLIYATPEKGFWYWQKTILVSQDSQIFLGPEQQTEIGTRIKSNPPVER